MLNYETPSQPKRGRFDFSEIFDRLVAPIGLAILIIGIAFVGLIMVFGMILND